MPWRDLDKTWHDTTVDYCDVCGSLLIRRFWAFSGADGETLRACREDDERLYRKLRDYRTRTEWHGRAPARAEPDAGRTSERAASRASLRA